MAVDQTLRTLLSYIKANSPITLEEGEAEESPLLSVLNFPPLNNPPRLHHRLEPLPTPLLHSSFEFWAETDPHAVALDFVHSLRSGDKASRHTVLTYGELNAAANTVSDTIKAEIQKAVDLASWSRIIPVHMSTSPELYISYLGVLKAGYGFCPIPQDAPAQRVDEILKDINSPVILGRGPFNANEEGTLGGVLAKSSWLDVAEIVGKMTFQIESHHLESRTPSGSDIAYLLFTSGSTGKPKGVQISHLAATCSIHSHATSIPLPSSLNGKFRWFQFASPTFDPSLMEIFVTLSCGATLCSADRDLTLTDPEAVINEAKATIMMATPSLAAVLRPEKLETLQYLWTMGEKLNRTVIDNFAKHAECDDTSAQSPRMLVNAYGPTEGAINCTYNAPVGRYTRGSIIGKPLPTCAMLVIDPNDTAPRPVPAGMCGELVLAGPQVGSGYLKRPEETSKAFVESSEYGPLYKTGDMARIVWDENGQQVLEFLGRMTSDQVKINGKRLELGEIESVVSTVPGIIEVVVLLLQKDQSASGKECLVACIVPEDKSNAKVEVVRRCHEAVMRHLPSYMCPSFYDFVDSLPRSSSGKVDRRTILAMMKSRHIDGGAPISVEDVLSSSERDAWDPSDSDSQSARELVVEALAVTTGLRPEQIHPSAGIFTLGIDSLAAVRLLQFLREKGIHGLSVRDILSAKTPHGLVSKIRESAFVPLDSKASFSLLEQTLSDFAQRTLPLCAERLGLSTSAIESVLPTTATQSGMLASFLRRSSSTAGGQKPSYIYHSVISLCHDVNISKLRKSFEAVIADYDSFRTVFCLVDDDLAPFAQCILRQDSIPQHDWAEYSVESGNSNSSKALLNRALTEAERSISLSRPPWKIALIKNSSETTLVLSMFHGIFDGGSLQLLLDDVSTEYSGERRERRTPLGYIVSHHFSADSDKTSEFWKEELQGYTPIAFPSLTPERPSQELMYDAVEVPARTSHLELKKQARSLNSTPLSVLQAAWASILLSYTGTEDLDVVLGSVVSGRLDTESERCIGPSFTTVPLRLALGNIQVSTNRHVVQHIADANARSLEHLQPRLGSIVTDQGQLPYDTLLAYQDFSLGSNSSTLWTSIYHPPMANDFAVMVEVWPTSDGNLTLRATYSKEKLDRLSTEAMLHEMSDIVAFILEYPNDSFLNSPARTRPDLKSISNPVPKSIEELPSGNLLHTQFENHAHQCPDDVALIFKADLENPENPANIEWSYEELNARANELARDLVHRYGPLKNVPVPICIEKSPSLYVAVLGILKAGGAWCPIDTLSPSERRRGLITRTGAKVLLTSSIDTLKHDDTVPEGVDIVDVAKFAKPDFSVASSKIVPPNTTTPDDMAYLIWTSGTTGAPKGVPIKHSAGVASMMSLQQSIPVDAPGGVVRCLQFSQYTFDVSIQDMFYTWGLGGVLISASREIMLSSFDKLANATNATHAHLTPSFAAEVRRQSCPSLRVVTMIGEKLPQSVADDWGANMRAFNTYGPAETTVVSTVREFGTGNQHVKSANIGWPLQTVSAFVVDNEKRPVMKNAIGELALGGPQLSDGYLGMPETNKTKFAWNEEAGQILYYTGDLVRMLSDGSMEYVSRRDDLVKLGGIRVELSEISFAIQSCHELVEQVETVILNRPDRPTDVLVSFLAAPGAAQDGTERVLNNEVAVEIARSASSRARATLPAHMLPSVYIVVPKVPRTASAKTDRAALKLAYASIDIDQWEAKVNSLNLSQENNQDDPEEKLVLDIVAELVDMPSSTVKKAGKLASIGLNSIRTIRLASKLNSLGYKVSVIDVLHCSSIGELLQLVTASKFRSARFSNNALDRFHDKWAGQVASKISESCRVTWPTPVQESLLSETMGAVDRYWSNHFFLLREDVDLARLRSAWAAVASQNEALRAAFVPAAELDRIDDELEYAVLQLIYAKPFLDWEEIECTEENFHEAVRSRVSRVMKDRQEKYFRYPPWAVTIYHRGSDRVLLLTLHHSIHDGTSLGYVFDDVQSSYVSEAPRRHQLVDALSSSEWIAKNSSDTVDFWRHELHEFSGTDAPAWPDLTNKRLPVGEAPPRRFLFKQQALAMTATQLQSRAIDLGVSSITTLLRTAWSFVVSCYLGAQATIVGETLSDRVLSPTFEDIIGPLISVVPIPFIMRGTVRELLAEQQRLSIEAWKHRHVHPRQVQKILGRQRGEALYSGIFTFHPSIKNDQSQSSPLWREQEDIIGLSVEHPMALNVFHRPDDSIVLELSCLKSIMNEEHLSLFLQQVVACITAMLEHPDESIIGLSSHLPKNLLSISVPTISMEVAESVKLSPTHWLSKYAEEHPDWLAVEVVSELQRGTVKKESLTFGTLNELSDRVASYILSLGIQRRIIALCSGRTLFSYPVIVGIFKSGNTYLPIDEALPDERKGFLVSDGDCPLLFTESNLLSTFSKVPDSCKIVTIDGSEYSDVLRTPASVPDVQSSPEDVAYLLYTSGSTGQPKGVLVTRGNVSAFVEAQSEFICRAAPATRELGGTGKWLALASRAFDVHIAEMILAWRHGLATVTGPRTMLLDDLQLALTELDITHASFVPSLLDQANIVPEHCPLLRYLSVGGEKISQRVLNTWGESDAVALVNAYGPTEVTIGCSSTLVTRETTIRNIGRPLGSSVAHVLVPGTETYTLRGQPGELCLTGDLVAKGYHNRPDAKGFIENFKGTRMYRTGDAVRLLADDSLEFLGRGDDQTKIRGQRLELGEVSEVIRSSSSVSIDVVTMIGKHPSIARTQLISFIADSEKRQANKDKTVTIVDSIRPSLERELREACQRKLPAYMVPEVIISVSHIPIAPMSGKADVKQLQTLFAQIPLSSLLHTNDGTAQLTTGTGETTELTAEEKSIIEILQQVVQVDRSVLTSTTNIFEIGIDSISAINLSVKLRNMGYEASVASVLQNPVVKQLARLPRSNMTHDNMNRADEFFHTLMDEFIKSSPNTDPSLICAVFPCLPLQEGLVARTINADGNSLYVNHVVLELVPDVDLARLRLAWEETVRENDILRTAFVPLGDRIVQVVFRPESHKAKWIELEQEDLDDASYQRDTARDIVRNISSAPPIRLLATSSQSGRRYLRISLHHSIYDGESLSMILDEVGRRYVGKQVIKRGDARLFLSYLNSQDEDKAKDFWTQRLKGCRPTLFRDDGAAPSEEAIVVHRTLSSKLSDVESLASALHTTAPALISAIFALVLADLKDSADITYGMVLSGRTIPVPGADTVLLPCITTIPARLSVDGLSSVKDVVKAVTESYTSSLEFQHTSLRHIQRWLRLEGALFDCLFSFIRTSDPSSHGLWTDVKSHMPADYPFAIEAEAEAVSNKLHLHCGYTSTFGDQDEAQRVLEKMDIILSELVDGEDPALSNFNLSAYMTASMTEDLSTWDNMQWSPLETKLGELVSDFCQIEIGQITKGASFIGFGIDSVLAIQFARKLRENGIKASSADVMRFSCVGALAAHIQETSGCELLSSAPRQTTVDLSSVEPQIPLLSENDTICKLFECSPLQSGMLTQTIASSGEMYVHPHVVRLHDSVDIAALKSAFAQVISSNDILRTSFHSFPELGYAWIGAVHSSPPLEWHEIQTSGETLIDVRKTIHFRDETSFESPPLRIYVITNDVGRYLAVVMHHALYDGVSLPFIFDDVAAIYNGIIPSSRPQFSEVVSVILENGQRAVEHWCQKLRGYRVVEIPALDTVQEERMLVTERKLELDASHIAASCREMEVTVQTVALLAFAKVYATIVGQRDIVFGHVVAGRSLSIPNVERTIGPLFNTVPERVTFDSKIISNKTMAKRIQSSNADAQEYQHAPLRQVQNEFRKRYHSESAALFDALFVFQKIFDTEQENMGKMRPIWEAHDMQDFVSGAEHKLNVEVEHASSGIIIRASCNSKYLSLEGLESFLFDFDMAFRDVVERPTQPVISVPAKLQHIPLRSASERGEMQTKQHLDSEELPSEQTVRDILADVAGVSRDVIQPTTSIYAIGLDSIAAIRVAALGRSKGLRLGVSDVLQGQTLRGISERVSCVEDRVPADLTKPSSEESHSLRKNVAAQLRIPEDDIETVVPCLSGQIYHLASWLKSGRTLFEPAWAYSSNQGRLDSGRLQDAWTKLRQRHPILRTCFVALNSSDVFQIVLKRAVSDDGTFEIVTSSDTVLEATKSQARKEVLRPSSMYTPPVRLRHIQAQDGDSIILLVNHAAYDAWTIHMFVAELEALYQGDFNEGHASVTNFPDFVNHIVQSVREEDTTRYWSTTLASSTSTIVQLSVPEANAATVRSRHLFVGSWQAFKGVSRAEEVCKFHGFSLQLVVLYAFAQTLARWTKNTSPTFGLYQNGRSAAYPDLEKLSGPCLNVLPFTIQNTLDASDNDTSVVVDKIRTVQAALAERAPYEQSLLPKVLQEWQQTTSSPSLHLFNAWVNLLWSGLDLHALNGGKSSIFTPLSIGLPTDFIPDGAGFLGEQTAVSTLNTSFLPDQNVFVDIGPDPGNPDTLGIGVRVEGGAMNEQEARAFIGDIVKAVEGLLSALGNASKGQA